MSLEPGFDTQTPSLPSGGGAVDGLGETFTTDLSTGTGSFGIPLDVPNGPNDIAPRLALRYDTGQGNGPFGLGFTLSFPRIVRTTAQGYPEYGEDGGGLTLEGAGEILSEGDSLRLRVDGGLWRIEREGEGFRLTDRGGLRYFLGTDAAGRLSGTDGSGRDAVYAWHLRRIEDALGNAVVLDWSRDASQLYLSRVAYGAYEVRFHYAPRPDRVHWGRAGFVILTALRCERVELHLLTEASTLVRRWTLAYEQAPGNAVSLLSSVTMSGFDAAGRRLDAPVLRLTYSEPKVRELVRFSSVDEGASPGPFAVRGRRAELLDWEGRGLPDLVEIGPGGRARRWPNVGECTWGRPERIGDVPWLGDPTAAIGFVDFDGDGAADLVRVDQPLGGYLPRVPGGGFGMPVVWTQAPRAAPDVPGVRLVDLDGDGRVDLMVGRGDSLLLYYREDERGWSARPQVVPRGAAPTVNLADPHILLGDMTGDGTLDIVRVDGGGVTWWPYLGAGRWSDPVSMANPPAFAFDLEPSRLFLTDVDGDGCADLVYVHEGRVRYWINQSGFRFGDERVIEYVPTGRIDQLRLADMRGTGTAGLLWCQPGALGRGTEYFYLDFTGGVKPYLLTGIDNGVGLRTRIEYTTSALEASRRPGEARPAGATLPVVIPIVSALITEDETTGPVSLTRYRYFSGRWDGRLREFAGFGRVEADDLGDLTQPPLRTTTWFHTGGDPETGAEPRDSSERHRWRALRGRIRRRERTSPDGTALAESPFDLLEQDWVVVEEAFAGQVVYLPRLRTTTQTTFERNPASPSIVTTANIAWDALGNITETLETTTRQGDPLPRSLRTMVDYAADPAGRFPSKAWQTRQIDAAGVLVAHAITEYDREPPGFVGAQGLVTRRRALVLPDAVAAAVYGASLPDFDALGYERVQGSAGWWVTLARYERTDDATGLRGTITGPRGAATEIEFDPLKQFPVRFGSPLGHVVTAVYDPRIARALQLTDASGAVQRSRFDPLARIIAWIAPGDSEILPTAAFEYSIGQRPVAVTESRRSVSGTAEATQSRRFFDGAGRVIEQRIRDDAGEIVQTSHQFGPRGWPSRLYRELRAAGPAYTPPPAATPHAKLFYDALGRIVRTVDLEGRVRTIAFGSGFVEEADEEDTRSGPGAPHAGTVTRRRVDPTGRICSIEQRIGARTLTTTYEYDVKGNLRRHVDAMGRASTMTCDLFGRVLRVVRPEQTAITVFDPAGNPVETRVGGRRVVREFDLRDRPLSERQDGEASPGVRFSYHDPGRPAPPEAGIHTLGRLARIDDKGGRTILDYDERGRVATRIWTPAGGGPSFRSDVRYRSDGQIESVQYPDGGAGRLVVTHAYNGRGLLSAISSAVNAIEYDLGGRTTAVHYANGVEWKATYDSQGRLASAALGRGGTSLWSATYELDAVGNLLRIGSPDPKIAATYVYDDLYRLTEATLGAGEHFTYQYDDAGGLAHKSDVGDYTYGENGAPATCVTSAGAGRFTYTPAGEIAAAPWGIHLYDALGRLMEVRGTSGSLLARFTYDYAGRRVRAQAGGSDLRTPDPFFSIEQGKLVLLMGDFVRRLSNGQRRFVHRDHLGSVVRVTDDAGTVVESRRYDPYGAVLETSGQAETPDGFGTGVPETTTGLVYLGSRYYHPTLGRFISADTMVSAMYDPAAWSAYTYCRGNPTSFVDPDGHDFWRIFAVVVAVIALIALTVFTAGASTALATAIIIGMAAGGVVGGITAARVKGHDGWDVVAGVLVGAAVGGYGALAGGALFGVVTHAVSGWAGGLLAGGLSGTVNGAAMGFATGFAAEDQFLDTILWRMAEGAVLGFVTGAVLGALGGAVKSGDIEAPKPNESIRAGVDQDLGRFPGGAKEAEAAEAAKGNIVGAGDPGAAPKNANPGSLAAGAFPNTTANATKAGVYLGGRAGQIVWVHTIVTDVPAGAWNVLRGWAVTPDEIKAWLKGQETDPKPVYGKKF